MPSSPDNQPLHINTLPIAAARYTDAPFPPYRFVPGRHPHPTAHPDGHSYLPPGHVEPPVTFVPPGRWRESPDYLYGCDLYNHAFWWEAHEAWEGLWRVTPAESAQRRFLQGVIQLAAIHIQLFQGHADGVARLRETSRRHLEAAMQLADATQLMGLDIEDTLVRIDAYCAKVMRPNMPPPWHDPATYPYITPMDDSESTPKAGPDMQTQDPRSKDGQTE